RGIGGLRASLRTPLRVGQTERHPARVVRTEIRKLPCADVKLTGFRVRTLRVKLLGLGFQRFVIVRGNLSFQRKRGKRGSDREQQQNSSGHKFYFWFFGGTGGGVLVDGIAILPTSAGEHDTSPVFGGAMATSPSSMRGLLVET